MKYTEKDLERAHATLFGPGLYEQRIAELIATVRRETVEGCARVCESLEAEFVAAYKRQPDPEREQIQREMADAFAQSAQLIRALLDEPKAEPVCGRLTGGCCTVKAGPKCKVCGGLDFALVHTSYKDTEYGHAFEPEDPDHG